MQKRHLKIFQEEQGEKEVFFFAQRKQGKRRIDFSLPF
jgi:hypothetical protein